MKLILDIPDAQAQRLIAGVCGNFGYNANLTDEAGNVIGPNPETAPAFTRRMIIEWLKKLVRAEERRIAEEAARVAAGQTADISIT